jgi:hypothetical protein
MGCSLSSTVAWNQDMVLTAQYSSRDRVPLVRRDWSMSARRSQSCAILASSVGRAPAWLAKLVRPCQISCSSSSRVLTKSTLACSAMGKAGLGLSVVGFSVIPKSRWYRLAKVGSGAGRTQLVWVTTENEGGSRKKSSSVVHSQRWLAAERTPRRSPWRKLSSTRRNTSTIRVFWTM